MNAQAEKSKRFVGDLVIFDIVKKVMKNYVEKQRKTSTSLPLEGGGRRVGVKE